MYSVTNTASAQHKQNFSSKNKIINEQMMANGRNKFVVA
jgi:hypothetical protein